MVPSLPPVANDNGSAELFRLRAAEFSVLASGSRSLSKGIRYRKMAQAYLALAHEHDWLEGKVPPYAEPRP
jgi:hypothetical protein